MKNVLCFVSFEMKSTMSTTNDVTMQQNAVAFHIKKHLSTVCGARLQKQEIHKMRREMSTLSYITQFIESILFIEWEMIANANFKALQITRKATYK